MELTVVGQRAYVYTGGKLFDAALPTVVFLHGAEQDHSCWNLQARWFAHHGWGVLVPDLPGHGRSAGEPLPSIAALADWTVALLAAAGANAAVWVGHSMGSLIAIDAALRHAPRVGKLALLGASLPMPVSEPLLDAARRDEAKAAALINAFSYSPAGQFGGNAVPGLWLLGVNRRLMERQKPGVFGCDMSACNAYARQPADLAGLRQPTLLIAGGQDRMTPPKAASALEQAIPDARLAVLPGAGHALMAERPDAVLDRLREFLA